jgi:tetratricopeptide (TPR) repeat protein
MTEARAALALYFEPLKWIYSALRQLSNLVRQIVETDPARAPRLLDRSTAELAREMGRVIFGLGIGTDKLTIASYRLLSDFAALAGDTKASRRVLITALRHFVRIHDLRSIPVLWLDLAAVYSKAGDLDKAEHSVRKAIETSETVHNDRLLAAALVNLGWIRQTQDRRGQAVEYYLKALNFFNEPDSSHIAATAYSNLAEIDFQELRLKDALQNLTKAIQLEENAGRNHVLVQNYMRRALLLDMLGDRESSRRSMMKAKELWQQRAGQPVELITAAPEAK